MQTATDKMAGARTPTGNGLNSINNTLAEFLSRLSQCVELASNAANIIYGMPLSPPPSPASPGQSTVAIATATNQYLNEIEFTIKELERNINRILNGN